MKQVLTIELSLKSVVSVLAIIVLLLIAWKIKGVLLGLFVAFVLMSGFAPLVDWLVKNGVNKALSVALTYLLAVTFLAALLFFALPPLIEQTRDFVVGLPVYVSDLMNTFNSGAIPGITADNITDIISRRLDQALTNLLQIALNVFTIFISFVTVAVFTFYLLLERDKVKKNLFLLFPSVPKKKVEGLAQKMEIKLGSWVRGQVVLMFLVGLSSFIGLSLLRIEFALPLAVIAGILELVPIIGPIAAVVPAALIAFAQSPILGVAVIALYILIQQLENNILVPKVMERAVGLSPLVTIFALLVGGSLFGVIGALLSVPVAAIGQVIFEDYIEQSKAS